DETLHRLHEIVDWSDAAKPTGDSQGVRYATLQPNMGTSAALELIQPKTATGRYGAYFARWGAGPHALRLGVRGLDAKTQDLRARGTRFAETESVAGERMLLVDESDLDGVIVELVEDPLPPPG